MTFLNTGVGLLGDLWETCLEVEQPAERGNNFFGDRYR